MAIAGCFWVRIGKPVECIAGRRLGHTTASSSAVMHVFETPLNWRIRKLAGADGRISSLVQFTIQIVDRVPLHVDRRHESLSVRTTTELRLRWDGFIRLRFPTTWAATC